LFLAVVSFLSGSQESRIWCWILDQNFYAITYSRFKPSICYCLKLYFHLSIDVAFLNQCCSCFYNFLNYYYLQRNLQESLSIFLNTTNYFNSVQWYSHWNHFLVYCCAKFSLKYLGGEPRERARKMS
jgi:hypothetical protein